MIHPSNGEKNLVYAIFFPFETNIICSLLLSFRLPKDQAFLVKLKNGQFIVKTAHCKAIKFLDLSNSTTSTFNINKSMWLFFVEAKYSNEGETFSIEIFESFSSMPN